MVSTFFTQENQIIEIHLNHFLAGKIHNLAVIQAYGRIGVYIYICVCVCVYKYTYIYIDIYMHKYLYIQVCIYRCVYIYL